MDPTSLSAQMAIVQQLITFPKNNGTNRQNVVWSWPVDVRRLTWTKRHRWIR